MGNENSIKTLSPHPQTTNYCNFINKFTKIFITFQHKTVHIQNLLLSNPSENVQRIWRILGAGAGHGTGRHKAPWITFNDEAPLIMFWRFIIYFKAANLALRSNAWELREIYPVFVFSMFDFYMESKHAYHRRPLSFPCISMLPEAWHINKFLLMLTTKHLLPASCHYFTLQLVSSHDAASWPGGGDGIRLWSSGNFATNNILENITWHFRWHGRTHWWSCRNCPESHKGGGLFTQIDDGMDWVFAANIPLQCQYSLTDRRVVMRVMAG